jgi:hypothetical protein
MVRSTYARELMPKALERTLEKISINSQRNEPGPWRVWYGGPFPDDKNAPLIGTHNGLAANLAFSASVLDGKPSSTASQAADELVRGQNAEGWWSAWAHNPVASVDITARALLAIAALRPRGHQRAISVGLEWLRQNQTESGYWFDRGQPDAVFVTVLVLEAISKCSAARVSRPAAQMPDQFEIALSFPGDVRQRVEQLADDLGKTLPKGSVFYDKYFTAQLARPDLDTFLIDIYRNRSKLVVVFVGDTYQRREWCGLEWRAVRDLIKAKAGDRVMFVRIDDGNVDGLLSIDGYVDLRHTNREELAKLVRQRLEGVSAQK